MPRRFPMKQRFARLAITGVCIALLSSSFVVATASAATIADKKAQAAQLQRQIDANGEQISALAEQYDGARLRLDEAKKNIVRVQSRLADAQSDTQRIGRMASRRAVALYMGAGGQSPFDSVDVGSVTEAGSRAQYAATTADRDSQMLDQLVASRQDLHSMEKSLETARGDAQKEVDALAANRRSIERANAQQHELLNQVKGEIGTLIAQEQARQAAAERAATAARLAQVQAAAQSAAAAPSSNGGGGGGPVFDPGPIPNTPAPSSGAAAAVAYAEAQLGKPYQYAATGPNSFDCSGLTMMAWAQGGVSMPHYSGAQGSIFPRVSDSALQPGDLSIYYPDHHHVAIYVGGGMTIAATHTGDVIRLQPVFRSGYQYSVRPG
jgi:cell wall-associated NlpC family hydrolase